MSPPAVPVVLVPTAVGPLVFPSATVCEIVLRARIQPAPGTELWVLGYCLWRELPVSVVSFELLSGAAAAASAPDAVVVLHPLPGRLAYDYVAVAAHGIPRSARIGTEAKAAAPLAGLQQRCIAGAVELADGTVGIIPDLDAMKAVFYPG